MKRQIELPKYGHLPPIKNVQVMTQSHCNCDCIFCPFAESEHAAARARMRDETWWLILANLTAFRDGINEGKFCPYLMNEPLIDNTIFAKIDDIYREFKTTCVEISTNGAALTPHAVDQLFERFEGRRHDLWVSHHGIDAESFTRIMSQDYERATKNLIYLLKASNGRFNVKIRGTGESRDGRHSYFTREQYLSYCSRLFDEHSINTNNVSIDAFTFHDRAGTLHRIDRGAHLLKTDFRRPIDPRHPFYCNRLDQWLHFKWNGDLALCCMDYHGEVKLPNVHEVPILQYFHGREYHDLCEKIGGHRKCEDGFICTRCVSPGG